MRCSLFDYGFRSQFLLAGLAAVVLVPLWILAWLFGMSLGIGWPPTLWHAHEMVFGFIASAISGFLLTAVPSWTGRKGFAGPALWVLCGLWIVARVLIATSARWPVVVTAAVDLAFLPAVGVLIAVPLVRVRNRNTPVLVVLAAIWMCDAVFHRAIALHDAPLASRCLQLAIDIVMLLVTVIGGRIVPTFTAAALRPAGRQAAVRSPPVLSAAAILAMAAVAVVDYGWPDSRASGVIAALAALAQALRLAGWGGYLTARQPIVWVLHVAYLWLPVGLAMKAVAQLSGSAWSAFWLHALTIGVASTMILAVMTRAALGHTGRPLVVHPLTVVAYLMLVAATVVRLFGLDVGLRYPVAIVVAGMLWTYAFLLFVLVYAPILWGPRVDGRPG